MPGIKLGLWPCPHPHDWRQLLTAAQTADTLGYDSLWVDDHILNETVDHGLPKYESWVTLTALAGATSQIRLGHLVNAVSFRNPALLAKQAVTLDIVSGGRLTLGLGGGWFELEHAAYGYPVLSSGERLDKLDEAASIIRPLLAGETVTHQGTYYQTEELTLSPPPIQHPLPILIGGTGEQKTLRTVARYADAWNAFVDDLDYLQEVSALLDKYCVEIGRDPNEIERTLAWGHGGFMIRDDPAEAWRLMEEILVNYAFADFQREYLPPWCGPPAQIAENLRPYVEMGFRHIILEISPPFDQESMERLIGEVKPMLERYVTAPV
jgi:F420-dependent oxidoreductase-like protein